MDLNLRSVSKYQRIRCNNEFPRAEDMDQSHSKFTVLRVKIFDYRIKKRQIIRKLNRMYLQFGEHSIHLSHKKHSRVAYIQFKTHNIAKNAKRCIPIINMFGNLSVVKPVYKSHNFNFDYESKAIYSPDQNDSLDQYQYNNRSNVSPDFPMSNSTDGVYEISRPNVPSHNIPLLLSPELIIRCRPKVLLDASVRPNLKPRHRILKLPNHSFHELSNVMPPIVPQCYTRLMHDDELQSLNYLIYKPSENKEMATRVLFISNLDCSISKDDLYHHFGKYGVIEYIHIESPELDQELGQEHSYVNAIIYYENVDMAMHAKFQVSSNLYINRRQCIVKYGISHPTKTIWVGGFNSQISIIQLTELFQKFGHIDHIYQKENTSVYVQFKTINAAISAVEVMRKVNYEDFENELKIDYASDYDISREPELDGVSGDIQVVIKQKIKRKFSLSNGVLNKIYDNIESEYEEKNNEFEKNIDSDSFEEHFVSSVDCTQLSEKSPDRPLIGHDVKPAVWQGIILCKDAQFPVKYYLISGDPTIVKSAITDTNNKFIFRITHRLRFEKISLQNIQQMQVQAMFLAKSCSIDSVANDNTSIQIRPLNYLINQFSKINAAGVKHLEGLCSEKNGLLLAFPICEYAATLLKISYTNLISEKDDQLVIAIVAV